MLSRVASDPRRRNATAVCRVIWRGEDRFIESDSARGSHAVMTAVSVMCNNPGIVFRVARLPARSRTPKARGMMLPPSWAPFLPYDLSFFSSCGRAQAPVDGWCRFINLSAADHWRRCDSAVQNGASQETLVVCRQLWSTALSERSYNTNQQSGDSRRIRGDGCQCGQ